MGDSPWGNDLVVWKILLWRLGVISVETTKSPWERGFLKSDLISTWICISIKNWMGPYQRIPKKVTRAIKYPGLGVRSVGPVGDFLEYTSQDHARLKKLTHSFHPNMSFLLSYIQNREARSVNEKIIRSTHFCDLKSKMARWFSDSFPSYWG